MTVGEVAQNNDPSVDLGQRRQQPAGEPNPQSTINLGKNVIVRAYFSFWEQATGACSALPPSGSIFYLEFFSTRASYSGFDALWSVCRAVNSARGLPAPDVIYNNGWPLYYAPNGMSGPICTGVNTGDPIDSIFIDYPVMTQP